MHNSFRRRGIATVTLKNVPDGMLQTLKNEAKQNRRSLSEEVLARLESSLAAPRRSCGNAVKALRRLHQSLAGLPPLTDAFLRRAKSHGRS